MKRALAFGLAIAMVVASLAIRHVLDSDSSGRDSGSGDAFRLLCATELRDVCDQAFGGDDGIVIKFENPGRTADSLVNLKSNKDLGFDGWLAPGPWSDILADNRRFAGVKGDLLGGDSDVLARSPVVIAMLPNAAKDVTSGACGPDVLWTCLVDQARNGGAIRIGVPDPGRGDGIAVAASAVSSLFDTTDYSASDLEQGDFSSYFESLTKLSRTTKLGSRTVLQTALTSLGSFSVIGTVEAEIAMLSSASDGLAIRYPEPMVTADVRLSTRKGLMAKDALDELDPDRLAEALAANGWRVKGQVPSKGAIGSEDLPATSNMASAGVLQLLRNEWSN
ncbi:MAG: hypothetical protein WBA45_09820 [Microthrixaceae bacterium]